MGKNKALQMNRLIKAICKASVLMLIIATIVAVMVGLYSISPLCHLGASFLLLFGVFTYEYYINQ